MQSITEICCAGAGALKQPQKPAQLLKSKYDYLVLDATITAAELELAARSARKKGCDLEDILLDEFQIGSPLIGKALSSFFEVKYEPYRADRKLQIWKIKRDC